MLTDVIFATNQCGSGDGGASAADAGGQSPSGSVEEAQHARVLGRDFPADLENEEAAKGQALQGRGRGGVQSAGHGVVEPRTVTDPPGPWQDQID